MRQGGQCPEDCVLSGPGDTFAKEINLLKQTPEWMSGKRHSVTIAGGIK
jgi:hypothetical protein